MAVRSVGVVAGEIVNDGAFGEEVAVVGVCAVIGCCAGCEDGVDDF